MTRSHTQLHCTDDNPDAARAEASEGKDPGSIWVLLKNPRWERHLLRFLELAGERRLVEGEDVEETRGARLDEWIAREAKERVAKQGSVYLSYLSFRFSFLEGPILRALRTTHTGVGGFLGGDVYTNLSFLFDLCTPHIPQGWGT